MHVKLIVRSVPDTGVRDCHLVCSVSLADKIKCTMQHTVDVEVPYPHASMGMLWEWLGELLFWVEGF